MKRYLLSGVAMLVLPAAAYANCPAITMGDSMGVAAGAFPQQYELSEFEAAAGCSMEFSENPAIGDLNARIAGNPALPPLADRLPSEPLVVVPYDSVGHYGGTFDALSNATEALLTRLGVQVLTSSKVTEVTATDVRLSDGQVIESEMVVWAAGVKAPEFLKDFGFDGIC